MARKTVKKTSTKKPNVKLSPKDADVILKQEFVDEETGIEIKKIFRLSPEPYFFRIKLDGVQKKDDN